MKNKSIRFIAAMIAVVFGLETILQPAQAQVVNLPNIPSVVSLNNAVNVPMIQGMQIDPEDGLKMSLIIDEEVAGNEQRVTGTDESRYPSPVTRYSIQEYLKLIKYFLTALTVPEKDLWVNLSPYEKDRMTSNALAQTQMGEELLAQDYLLKKLTASLISPEGETGKAFWEKVYSRVYNESGLTDLPIESLSKVWIMPDKAEVFAENNTVLILDSRLKVMMESDYAALEQAQGHGIPSNLNVANLSSNATQLSSPNVSNLSFPNTTQLSSPNVSIGDPASSAVKPKNNDTGSWTKTFQDDSPIVKNIFHQIIIPIIEDEVNNGEQFAQLRQIFHALILARWYKDNLKQTILGSSYADQSKVSGLNDTQRLPAGQAGTNNDALNDIYQQYLQAFNAGAEGVIKEDYDPSTQSVVPKKYVTGGWKTNLNMLHTAKVPAREAAGHFDRASLSLVNIKMTDSAMMGSGIKMFLRTATLVAFIAFFAACQDRPISKQKWNIEHIPMKNAEEIKAKQEEFKRKEVEKYIELRKRSEILRNQAQDELDALGGLIEEEDYQILEYYFYKEESVPASTMLEMVEKYKTSGTNYSDILDPIFLTETAGRIKKFCFNLHSYVVTGEEIEKAEQNMDGDGGRKNKDISLMSGLKVLRGQAEGELRSLEGRMEQEDYDILKNYYKSEASIPESVIAKMKKEYDGAVWEDVQKFFTFQNSYGRAIKLFPESKPPVDKGNKDKAMMTLDQQNLKGGVDLNMKDMNFSSKGLVNFTLPKMENGMLNIHGLTPVILNVTPIKSVGVLLGLNDETPQDNADESSMELSKAIRTDV